MKNSGTPHAKASARFVAKCGAIREKLRNGDYVLPQFQKQLKFAQKLARRLNPDEHHGKRVEEALAWLSLPQVSRYADLSTAEIWSMIRDKAEEFRMDVGFFRKTQKQVPRPRCDKGRVKMKTSSVYVSSKTARFHGLTPFNGIKQ